MSLPGSSAMEPQHRVMPLYGLSTALQSQSRSSRFLMMRALHDNGFTGYIRPDHGRMIWGETGRPGYGLYDRALGIAYINGVWEALEKQGR